MVGARFLKKVQLIFPPYTSHVIIVAYSKYFSKNSKICSSGSSSFDDSSF